MAPRKKMKLLRKLSTLFFSALAALLPLAALAIEAKDAVIGGLGVTADRSGLQTSQTDLPTIAGLVVNSLFTVIGVIFLTVILIGGYTWMTAGGDEEKIKKAKGWIVNGINGMIVIFLAYALVYVILLALKGATEGAAGV